jgi:uncharacterized protein involved in cysteine biosynthesis
MIPTNDFWEQLFVFLFSFFEFPKMFFQQKVERKTLIPQKKFNDYLFGLRLSFVVVIDLGMK